MIQTSKPLSEPHEGTVSSHRRWFFSSEWYVVYFKPWGQCSSLGGGWRPWCVSASKPGKVPLARNDEWSIRLHHLIDCTTFPTGPKIRARMCVRTCMNACLHEVRFCLHNCGSFCSVSTFVLYMHDYQHGSNFWPYIHSYQRFEPASTSLWRYLLEQQILLSNHTFIFTCRQHLGM